MATEIASAYLSLIPSAQGFQARLQRELAGPISVVSDRAGGDASTRFMSGFGSKAKVLAGLAASAVAVAGAAIGVAAIKGFNDAIAAEQSSDKLAASLGLTPAEAEATASTAARIYRGAWGDSLDAVNSGIAAVVRQIPGLQDVTNPALEGITTRVIDVGTAFDQDFGEVARAVGTMMRTGLAPDAETALDIITTGFQGPVNAGNDFLDTLNEYGSLFRGLGLDGAAATGILTQGLDGGARSADLVGDALKEFGIRAVDGSQLTADGFEMIGLSAEDMADMIAQGGPTAARGLDITLDRLRAIEDPVLRSQAAVALFGTQAEDLGDALYSLDPSEAVSALGDVEGATDNMSSTLNDNLGTRWESLKRRFLGSFSDWASRGIEAFSPLVARVQDAFSERGIAGALEEAGEIGRELWPRIRDGLLSAVRSGALFGFGGYLLNAFARDQGGFREAGTRVWAWIVDTLPVALERFGVWLGGALQWLGEVGAPRFREWMANTFAPGLWEWLKTSAGPLLLELGILLGRAGEWFVTVAVPWMHGQSVQVWSALFDWLRTTAAPWLWAQLPVVLGAVRDWFWGTFVPWLVSNYPQWAAAFTEWVTTTAIPWLLIKLVELQAAFGTWITDTALPWLRGKAGEWAAALVDWIKDEGIPAARTKLGEWLGDIADWAAGLPSQLSGMLLDAGTDLVAGLWQGITDRWDGLVEDLAGLVDQLPGVVKDVLGISSPSKVMMELGADTARGFALGIEKVAPSAEVATYQAARFAADGVRSRQSGFRPLSRAGRQPVQLMVNEDVLATTTIDSLRTRERAGQ